MKRSILHLTGICVALCLVGGAVLAGPVVGWRTDGTSQYPKAVPVTSWSPTENILWESKMPGWSNASPVIVGDRLFVCSERTKLVCVQLSDGKILWTKSINYEDLLDAEGLAAAKKRAGVDILKLPRKNKVSQTRVSRPIHVLGDFSEAVRQSLKNFFRKPLT